jgi:DNA repair photolyase
MDIARAGERVLHPLRPGEPGGLGFDVADGCGGACIHCLGGYVSEAWSGEKNVVRARKDTPARLKAELEELLLSSRLPKEIRLGILSDPFWPDREVVEAARASLEVAWSLGVKVVVHTRQVLPDAVAEAMKRNADKVHVVLGVMTARESSALVYEPNLPASSARLRSIRPLTGHGVPVTLRVHPLVPLVNDTEADLESLMQQAAKNGVRRAEFSYLQMSTAASKGLARGLPRMHREMLKGLFGPQPWVEGPYGQRKLLPQPLRDAGYERALDVSRRLGIQAVVREGGGEGTGTGTGTATLSAPGREAAKVAVPGTTHSRRVRDDGAQLGLFGQGLQQLGLAASAVGGTKQ